MPRRAELPPRKGDEPHSNKSGHHGWLWDGHQTKSDQGIELPEIKPKSISSADALIKGNKRQTKPSEGLNIAADGTYLGKK